MIRVALPLGLEFFSWKIGLHVTFKDGIILIVIRVIFAQKLFAQSSPGTRLQ